MIDHDDAHNTFLLIDFIDHAEVTPSGTVLAVKIKPKRSTDPLWILCQTAIHEPDTRARDLAWEPIE